MKGQTRMARIDLTVQVWANNNTIATGNNWWDKHKIHDCKIRVQTMSLCHTPPSLVLAVFSSGQAISLWRCVLSSTSSKWGSSFFIVVFGGSAHSTVGFSLHVSCRRASD